MNVWKIPDFLPRGLALSAAAEWPSIDWPHWHTYHDKNSRKFGTLDILRLPPACKMAFEELCKLDVDRLCGDPRAFPDALGHAAGLHWIPPGGYLGWHTDASQHPTQHWTRKLSVSIYLSENLQGGDLMLRDEDEEIRVRPKFNQLVIFEPDVQHSVDQVESTLGRKSIACFFWDSTTSNGSTRSEFA